jgi:aspartate ammonia-lyase
MGCLPGVSLANVDEYARNLFKRIENNVREACDRVTTPEHNIEFTTSIVSAATGTCVAQTFNNVVRRYANPPATIVKEKTNRRRIKGA